MIIHWSACIARAASAGLVDYVVEPGTSAEERGMVLARDIAQVRTVLTGATRYFEIVNWVDGHCTSCHVIASA